MKPDESALRHWIGKTETRRELLTQYPARALAATLDKSELAGTSLPPLWHWLYFLETAPQSKLATDGHATKGDFLPPIDLPRRMWAGSRIDWLQPLRLGEEAERVSIIKDIQFKQGRSGALAFVCVQHTLSNAHGVALREEHDIVYRAAEAPGAVPAPAQAAPAQADYSRVLHPTSALLFRYSALTFNAHRIHYDREFASTVEGYPGLVVHGPLLATLMVDLLLDSHPDQALQHFSFRALRPLFDLHPFTVCVNRADTRGQSRLWVQDADGALCMDASAILGQT